MRQAEDGTFIGEGIGVIMISFVSVRWLSVDAVLASTAYPNITSGHAARVLAGLSSIAQVQGCVVGRSGGQQRAASTAVLCAWVVPPQLQQGASRLSISGIPSRAAPPCARSGDSKGARPTAPSLRKESWPTGSRPALVIPTPDGLFSGA